ncbi:MAG: hypothetical protein EB111_02340 [Actinobacteria bacterium]|nr:hypothetical protein [Actinomycetota bacterium]
MGATSRWGRSPCSTWSVSTLRCRSSRHCMRRSATRTSRHDRCCVSSSPRDVSAARPRPASTSTRTSGHDSRWGDLALLRATSGWDRTPEFVGECAYQWPAVDNWPEDDDLIGQGADLHVATLIDGYKHGLFAMERAVGDGTLFWWSPAQRCIIPLDGLRVTRSMRRSARRYHLRINSCFESCAARGGGRPARLNRP